MDIKNKYTHYSADQLLNDFWSLSSIPAQKVSLFGKRCSKKIKH